MPIPDFQSLMLPLLKLTANGSEHRFADVVEGLSAEFQLSGEDRSVLLRSGQTRMYNRVGWAKTYLVKAGLLRIVGIGRFELTERGRELLRNPPPTINVAFLTSNFAEMADFRQTKQKTEDVSEEPSAVFDAGARQWILRSEVASRIADEFQRSFPNDEVRRDSLQFLAAVIESADEERGDAWFIRETDYGFRLMTGRLLACEVRRSRIRVAIVGPLSDEIRNLIGSEAADDFEFKQVVGGVIISFPSENAKLALEALKDKFSEFVSSSLSRVRQAVNLSEHDPEAVEYIASVIERELPQPLPAILEPEPEDAENEINDEIPEMHSPEIRGRAPIFEVGQRAIASLIEDIDRGTIALPDLQRKFVWEDTKVRDLLDSLFVGFPVGTLVFWHTSDEKDARALGKLKAGQRASTLVIDGQQRLTSLYAIMKGIEVTGKDGTARKINIAFRPRDGRFEVADAAIRNDPEYLPDITELWKGLRPKPQIRRDLLDALRDRGRVIDVSYEEAAERNLDRASSMNEYRFPTVEIRKASFANERELDEEDIADIFVRLNNQGTRLGQADFVLTLLSVFHGELRERIEDHAKVMSKASDVEIDAQQLLRVICGVGFGRAKMSAVYKYLRGVDSTTRDSDTEKRAFLLEQLDVAADDCLNPTPWRDFLLRVQHAGYVNSNLVSAKNAIVNAYALYVRGLRVKVPRSKLDELVSRWVFGSLLTSRYSAASETRFDEDLMRVSELSDGDTEKFLSVLDEALAEALTGDYWTGTLISALGTHTRRAPVALAFKAAQVVLGGRALFSDQRLNDFFSAAGKTGRSSSEAHHLFPVAWLKSIGVRDRKTVNQLANFADVGWHANGSIGSQSPSQYVPKLRTRLNLDDDQWGRMCAEHALPVGWETMDYDSFLKERRTRMADIIHVAYRKLGGEAESSPLSPPWFLPGSEEVWRSIGEVERTLRRLVRETYEMKFGFTAAEQITQSLTDVERVNLLRALRARPADADPLTVVDYLYLGQLAGLLFASSVWNDVKTAVKAPPDFKKRFQSLIDVISPVRNEIAHVREVSRERLLRANLACTDLTGLLRPE